MYFFLNRFHYVVKYFYFKEIFLILGRNQNKNQRWGCDGEKHMKPNGISYKTEGGNISKKNLDLLILKCNSKYQKPSKNPTLKFHTKNLMLYILIDLKSEKSPNFKIHCFDLGTNMNKYLCIFEFQFQFVSQRKNQL